MGGRFTKNQLNKSEKDDINMKEYVEIEMYFGNIEKAVKLLQEQHAKGCLTKLKFNGHWLYSDTVTLDCAYKEITGHTKAEHDRILQEHTKEREKQERAFRESLPDLEQYYVEKGHNILSEDKRYDWDKIVPIKLRDLYHGMELGNCLDIVDILNNNGSLEDAKEKMNAQGHSGVSWGLVRELVRAFADRGEEFANYIE